MRTIYALTDALEEYHDAIHDAITGGLPLEKPSELRQNYERFLQERRAERLRRLGADTAAADDAPSP
jgi:hypothetical protein